MRRALGKRFARGGEVMGEAPPPIWNRTLHLPPRWRRAVPSLLVFGLLAAVALRDALLGGVFYARDIHLLWQPTTEAFVKTVAGGAWPVWNPFNSFGQPLLANPTSQVFYPLTWLNMILPTWTYYKLFVFSHVLWAAGGAALLARRLGLGRAGATVAGGLWMTSGPLLSLGNVWAHLSGASWIPWVVLAVDRAVERRSPASIALGAATMVAPLLSGSPEMTLAGAVGGMLLGLHRMAALPRPAWSRERLAMAAAGIAVAVGAVGLGAAQLLPAAELVSRSARSALTDGTRLYWSLHPWSLLDVFWPIAPGRLPLHTGVRAMLYEGREAYLGSLYLGAPALALALAGVLARRRAFKWPLVAVALFLGLIALGRHLPAASAILSLPVLSTLRYPVKAMVPLSLAVALLAGFGFEALRDDVGRPGPRRALVIAFLLVLALTLAGGAWLAFHRAEEWGSAVLLKESSPWSFTGLLEPVGWRLAVAAGAAAAAGVVLLLAPGSDRTRRQVAIAVAALAALDLVRAHEELNPTAPAAFFRHRSSLLPFLQGPPGERVFVFDYLVTGAPRRYLGHSQPFVAREQTTLKWAGDLALREYPMPTVLPVWGILSGYERDLINLHPVPITDLSLLRMQAEGSPMQRRLLRMGSVRSVVSLHRETYEDLPLRASVPGPFREPMLVLEVPDTLPPAYPVSGARIADGADALAVLRSDGFDPAREVLLPQGTPRAAVDGFQGACEAARTPYDRVDLRCTLSHDGFVVLSDTFDPGWQVTVDGTAAPLLRGNHAFRAVAAPAGSHRIRMVYRPRPLMWGLAVSGACWLVALGGLAWSWRRAAP